MFTTHVPLFLIGEIIDREFIISYSISTGQLRKDITMKDKEKISYWTDTGNYDLKSGEFMQKSGRYVYTAFLCQQALEKYLKALHIKKYSKEAPRTHNLVYLVGLLELEIGEDRLKLLTDLTSYYIEGRYPTYKQKISKVLNKKKAESILSETKRIMKWLKLML
jgi:HEPN domain-containing protein